MSRLRAAHMTVLARAMLGEDSASADFDQAERHLLDACQLLTEQRRGMN